MPPPSPRPSPLCARPDRARTRYATFAECPHCGGTMRPEHAHERCASCGWRDSCCD